MDPNENNHYRKLTSHISAPLPGDQIHILMNPAFRRPNEEMNRRFVREEMHVREELSKRMPPYPKYGLQFINKVKDPTYTTKPVRDNNGDPIRVELYDYYNRSRVSSDCFLSCAKVRITVLDADFWKNRINWSRNEFVQNMLRGRDGKEPILIYGNPTIQLENGVGTFGNIAINDNSSCTKLGFQLGVMVEGDGQEGYFNGERVQEGVSEPFQVRDQRTEGDIPARYGQHPPICDSSSLNEHISTASTLFPETNCINDERGNILNRNSVHRTIGVDAESSPNYNIQVPLGGGSYGYGHGQFPRSFPRGDTAAWWDCPRGPQPPSCRDRLIIGFPARYGQLPPICDSSSMNVLNEHISTAPASALFPETNVREEIHVTEELGKISQYNLPPSRGLPYPNMQPQYGLRFINKVKDLTYTTKPVRDNNEDPIRIELYDYYNRSRVSSDCFLSSAKVRITVLDADFWKNRVNWSRNVFVENVLRGREGKEPILIGGSPTIQLENGVGIFGNIVFNDNSSWTKCGFRLGVMVKDDREEGYWNGERVQEGVSEPFQVRDRRTEASKKPDVLNPTHSVKYIKKIGKQRTSLLQKENINTVEDFLKFYNKDGTALRQKLGIKSETGKEWVSMVEHVKQCADQVHTKYNALNNSSQPRQALVLLMERNMPLCTNGEPPIVGSGSSEPNPCEDDRIEGNMPEINRQSSSIWDHPFEPLFFNEHGDTMQPTNDDGFFQYDLQFGP